MSLLLVFIAFALIAEWTANEMVKKVALFGAVLAGGAGVAEHGDFLSVAVGPLPLDSFLFYLGAVGLLALSVFFLPVNWVRPAPQSDDSPWWYGLGWGFIQQTLLLAFLYEGFGFYAAVGVFVLLHLPNPFLCGLTAIAGALSIGVYTVAPSLLIAGGAHAVLSFFVDATLRDEVTGGMLVGRGYVERWMR